MFDSRWDAGLDDAQLAAVTHGDTPLVILAGAGTGKTRTLTSRVAHLLERGVAPERVLLLTFTRRAAEDMVARAATLCADRDSARRVWGGTFHAVAHRLVAEHAPQLGLAEVSLIDPGDVTDLIDLLRDDHGLTNSPVDGAKQANRIPRAATLADIYSRSVNTGRPAREIITADFPWCEPQTDQIMALLKDFIARKRARGLLDFDDLLLAWRALLGQPAIAERLVDRWDHVLVDEYQDVNQIQVDIVAGLRPTGRGLTVVGDDAQAVYGFRGANSGHLLDVTRSHSDATVVRLERNFRSRQPLLDLANVIRSGAEESRLMLQADRAGGNGRRPKLVRCYDAAEEARLIADAVLQGVDGGQRLKDHAVLMRTGHHSDLLEVELTARRIPFMKFGGLKFLEAAHVKDFLAALRLTSNHLDEVAWFRILRLHEGIGPARARALLDLVLVTPETADAEPDADAWLNSVVAAAPAQARTCLTATLRQILDSRIQAKVSGQVAVCARLITPLVERRYNDAAPRLADLERLAAAAATSLDIPGFVAQVTLDPPASTGDYAKPPHIDEDYVTLSTVHSAKGLEWPSVHVIHAVDGAFPSDMALSTDIGLEEEQRLFYVAVTRARDELAIYAPLRMPHHRRARDDKHSYAPESRFFTQDALAVMDVVESPRPTQPRMPAGPVLPAAKMPVLDALFD
ncbi:MAG: UvrD/REP helicase [Pseudonocardiales bacterium]|nr:UvrD/REP helicase [Pseudonocardiales bacterium]